MKNFEDFENLTIYFIGIGGISMSGLCLLSRHFGAKVMGSDIGFNAELNKLISLGIKVNNQHNSNNITKDIDLVVYTSAISNDNPEYAKAIEIGIKTIERSEFIGVIASLYENVIAVSGTHGKTTTTAMLGEIMVKSNLSPTIHLGGESLGLGGNTIIGNNKYLVIEACEYKESFRFLKPNIAIITNIELDHLDYYKNIKEIENAFQAFADNSINLIVPYNCNIHHRKSTVIFKDWEIKNLEFVANGYNYNVYKNGEYYETFRLNMLGYHNVQNSLFAIAVADKLGIDRSVISTALSSFVGVGRRYETIHIFKNGCRVIIDYAHHYTEIKNSINGISEIYKKILVVFQPHTYSRTLKLFDEFVETLSNIENIFLYKTYPAREKYMKGGSAIDLYRAITSNNKKYFTNEQQLMSYIEEDIYKFDCILILGAGDLAEKLKRKYSNYI